MPRHKYGYTDDYLQFITWNFKRRVNLSNPNIMAKISPERKRIIESTEKITGINIGSETPKYWKDLKAAGLYQERERQFLDILTGKRLNELNSTATINYWHALEGYSVLLSMRFNALMGKLKNNTQLTADFLSEIPSAKDFYVAKGYSINKRSEAKRQMGEADMALNATMLETALDKYEKLVK